MTFRQYAIKKTIIFLITVYAVITLNFVIFRLMPGDPARLLLDPRFPAAAKDALIKLYGLDKNLFEQYVIYIKNLFTGELGISFISQQPVLKEILERLPNTILLLGVTGAITIIVGITLGVYVASKRGTKKDISIIGSSLFFNAVPTFFVGLVLLLTLGFYAKLFPLAGTISRPPPTDPFGYSLDLLWHLTLPAISLVVTSIGGWILYLRNILIDVLTQDYIVTAKAKGLPERRVLYGHAVKSIYAPLYTIIGLSIPGVLTGAVITEFIFSWHGMGLYLLDATFARDFPVLQGSFFIISFAVVLANYIVDITYGFVDPRIKR